MLFIWPFVKEEKVSDVSEAHSCRHPLSRKNLGRDRRKPQKLEIRLGHCRNWLETLENPADRWWSVCSEKWVKRWLVIALVVQNPTFRAQTATHWGCKARTTWLFLFPRLRYSFDDLSACIRLLPSSKAACGCLIAQSGRVIDIWWDGSSISWQGGGLDADYTLICSEERSCVIVQSSFLCLRTQDYGFFFFCMSNCFLYGQLERRHCQECLLDLRHPGTKVLVS